MVIYYVLEPIMRMRALVALSLFIALQAHHLMGALLTGFGAALLIHMLQIVVMGFVAGFLILVAGDNSIGLEYAFLLVVPCLLIAQALGLLYVYGKIRAWALGLALRHAFAAR